ncbi:MAG TPA: MFS transporter [Anaerolineae bacterium]|nr:MFS transporter [Anaerolineae bacterium]HOQ99856.1 MFS transporter [Anaerolineae bacterium]HPL28213.1 MFS transporter [Anaerolineae bacterium]
MPQLSEPDTRHNIAALGVDYVTFSLGITFLGATTLLPTLLSVLGAGPVVIGSVGTIQTASWMLPQLFAGRYVANRPLVKWSAVVPAVVSRSFLLLLVPAVWLTAARTPQAAIAAVLVGYAAFGVCDSLASVAWFELVAKALPASLRGRLLGGVQSLASLLGIGAGAVVAAVLARPGPAWANHVLLLAAAALCCAIGPGFLASIREPRGAAQEGLRPGWGHYLPRLAAIMRSDSRFVWCLAVRLVAGLADMAGGFYILYAAQRLHLGEGMIGLFASATVAGGLLSGLLLGPLGDRKGSSRVIVVIMLLRCLTPAMALLAPFIAGAAPSAALAAFVIVFVSMGMANSANMVGFFAYLMAIAPPGESSTYIALVNTLCGLLTVAPLVAGWLVQLASYEFVFALALGLAALGLAVALRGPRQAALATGAAPGA